MMNNVGLIEFEGNSNIGNNLFANDKFCLIGNSVPKRFYDKIATILKVPVYPITILNTSLVGIFLAGNNYRIVVPKISSKEFLILKKICEKHSVELTQIEDYRNTFGNNIVLGADEILINSKYDKKFLKQLKMKTNLNIIRLKKRDFDTIGSLIVFIKEKYFVSQEFTEQDLNQITNKICGVGSVNKGSYFVAGGIVGNKNGVLLGAITTTVEIQNILESLDYI